MSRHVHCSSLVLPQLSSGDGQALKESCHLPLGEMLCFFLLRLAFQGLGCWKAVQGGRDFLLPSAVVVFRAYNELLISILPFCIKVYLALLKWGGHCQKWGSSE